MATTENHDPEFVTPAKPPPARQSPSLPIAAALGLGCILWAGLVIVPRGLWWTDTGKAVPARTHGVQCSRSDCSRFIPKALWGAPAAERLCIRHRGEQAK